MRDGSCRGRSRAAPTSEITTSAHEGGVELSLLLLSPLLFARCDRGSRALGSLLGGVRSRVEPLLFRVVARARHLGR